MIKTLSIAGIFIFISMVSGFAQETSVIVQDTIPTAECRTSCVKEMTRRSFIKEIYDFRRKSTSWQYKDSVPAVLVMYANWCSPCTKMKPVVEKLAEEYKSRIKFYRINIDTEKDIANYFKVRFIPLFILIPLNTQPILLQGLMDEATFRKHVEDNLLCTDSTVD